jgi:hypothetical protein
LIPPDIAAEFKVLVVGVTHVASFVVINVDSYDATKPYIPPYLGGRVFYGGMM